MEIEKFTEKLKECKRSLIQTGTSMCMERIGDLKISVNPQRNLFKISKRPEQKICHYCGTDLTKKEEDPLIIEFNQNQNRLSIFQAYLIYMVFKLNMLPADYAKYHECIAGKEFIENIKNINNP